MISQKISKCIARTALFACGGGVKILSKCWKILKNINHRISTDCIQKIMMRAAGEKNGYFEGLEVNIFGLKIGYFGGRFSGRTPPGVGGGVRILRV